ncbi:hypothetical protein SAMN05216299_1089 [Nitrosospira sp. Nsp14]|nr:hypothetical protein SAMN05216299_1089 [Nitrosospira sp. Nsp14]
MPRPRRDALRPLLFSNIMSPEVRRVVDSTIALHLDCFGIFFAPIEGELGPPLFSLRWTFSPFRCTMDHYQSIEAMRYALEYGDGMSREVLASTGSARCGHKAKE